ncbi:MAG: two-component sensor histidine kinase [Rhodobacteraceae bacterium PARR1]|nr:MAG: two-component sensor histidine kinase [Rhodobacteraceae bacterium PARR1]
MEFDISVAMAADLIALVPLPMLIIGQSSRILAANPAAEARFGTGLTGRHYLMVLRQPVLQGAVDAGLAGGATQTVRLVLPQGQGGDEVFRVTVAPLARPAGAVLTFEDVTESEQVGQMRRDFVANVSHELRTPLTALSGFIETLGGAARDDAAARARFLAIMAREAGRMNRLVQDLLHLSRVEAAERVRPTTRIDLQAVLASTLGSLRPLAEEAGVRLDVEGEPGPLPVLADQDQIVQVLSNLIENAVKYGGAGGVVTVRLAQDSLPAGPAIRVDVIDRGEGIDPVHLPRLTERFYRVDGHRSREKGGTGLGLAIVKHIINRHRGRLRIDSTPGVGSVFSILLPQG